MKNTKSKLLEEFTRKVKEVENARDGKMSSEFGYKYTQRTDYGYETWTIPDWGNIKNFFSESLNRIASETEERVRKETAGEIKRHFETMVFDATVIDTGDTNFLREQYIDRIMEFRKEQRQHLIAKYGLEEKPKA